jgi:signal transduction histidine kinase
MALDEFSFYTEALTAWLASNCQDKSQLLQGKALEDAKQFVGCRSLSEADYQFLIASQELEKQELLKQLEVARQATQSQADNRLMTQFVMSVAYEFRSPLHAIRSLLRLVINRMTESLERDQKHIVIAHEATLDLLDITDNLLDVAKIEAGKFSIELLAPVKLYELLTDVENSVQTTHKKHSSFQIIKPTTHDKIITYGHYDRLRKVILTLVGNGIRVRLDQDGITIVVEMIEQKVVLKNQEHPGLVKIHVVIKTNRSNHDSVFEFFHQQMNDTSLYDWYGSPAFGLAFSKKLIEAMSGEFHFDVDYVIDQQFPTVTISLPLYQNPVMT